MSISTQLHTRDEQHIRTYNDLLIVRATGVSVRQLANVLGYAHSSALNRKLNRFKKDNQYLPLHLSCLIEAAMWRLGKMKVYINTRRAMEGTTGICWERLPDSF